jgi:hypothetical protein
MLLWTRCRLSGATTIRRTVLVHRRQDRQVVVTPLLAAGKGLMRILKKKPHEEYCTCAL